MPWASLDMPSLAISVLRPVVETLTCIDKCIVTYANIKWAEFVYEKTNGEITQVDYERIMKGYFVGTGEWIFSSALHDHLDPPETSPFYQVATDRGADLSVAAVLYKLAPAFTDTLADSVMTGGPGVVGISTSFDQNVPSLALARRLKLLTDEPPIVVLGGANCDGIQGHAIHRNFPFVDYVLRGEGEVNFPRLLTLLHESKSIGLDSPSEDQLREIPGLCWRDKNRASIANPPATKLVTLDRVPAPDHSDFFTEFRNVRVTDELTPKIVAEGGRGCWWGEKHHCTFCGLNGSLMAFRKKSSSRLLDEISAAVSANECLDVIFADNILDMDYIDDFLGSLAQEDWDLRLFFEVKSNLKYRQLWKLAAAGVTQIQPGIESLSGRVLNLMKKGVQGWQNVRHLRDCRTLTIYPGYNILYGFPGESVDDYESVIGQIKNLVHLTPPEAIYRILLTRFSPYFNDEALGLKNLGPSGFLSLIYKLPREELSDLVYVFESEPTGIQGRTELRLKEHWEMWSKSHPGSRLVAFNEADGIRVVDERVTGNGLEAKLRGAESYLYQALLRGATVRGLRGKLHLMGYDVSMNEIDCMIREWLREGLVFKDGDHYLSLATGLGYD